MRPTIWRYSCGNCGSTYELPGADLSFAYGTFLGVSRSGHAVVFDAVGDAMFDELRARVAASPAVVGLTDGERRELLQALVEAALDPASDGEPMVITGSPGCSACGSRSVASFSDTGTSIDSGLKRATHIRWDSLGEAERERLVVEVIARRIDGA